MCVPSLFMFSLMFLGGSVDTTVYFDLLICAFPSVILILSSADYEFSFHSLPLTAILLISFPPPSSFLPFSKPPEKWGGFVPPALARDEWNLGPEEAGAGWPPHSWPFEGRQAAHHSKIGLGQRVSRIRAVRRFTISTCGFQTCLHCSFSRTNNSLFKLLLPLMILILGDLGLLCSFPAYLIVSLFIL